MGAIQICPNSSSLASGATRLSSYPSSMDDELELDEAQSAILASMHELMLRRGTEAGEYQFVRCRQTPDSPIEVAAVVKRYHRNVEVLHDTQQRM